jgi:hypothetical protein
MAADRTPLDTAAPSALAKLVPVLRILDDKLVTQVDNQVHLRSVEIGLSYVSHTHVIHTFPRMQT